eukprot:2135209-Amphidinium_carterae.1
MLLQAQVRSLVCAHCLSSAYLFCSEVRYALLQSWGMLDAFNHRAKTAGCFLSLIEASKLGRSHGIEGTWSFRVLCR